VILIKVRDKVMGHYKLKKAATQMDQHMKENKDDKFVPFTEFKKQKKDN